MARTRNPDIVKRNQEMYSEWLRGASITSLSLKYGIARQVASRAIIALHPEGDEDEDRSLYRGHLWRLFDEVKELYDSPGFKMSPTGRPAEDPNGDPAEDTNVKLQAAELELKVLESLRKLDARDKPQQQQLKITHEVAEQQARASIDAIRAKRAAELEELARAGVVRGEVIRELPAAGS